MSDALGGEAGLRAFAAAGLGRCSSTSCPTTWRCRTRTRSGRDPGLRRSSSISIPTAAIVGSSTSTSWPAYGWRTPRCSRSPTARSLELVRDGVVSGVRVDHVDGLADPAGYLQRLREAGVEHVWVEKIVEPGEMLPAWPVEGTTGYDFLVDVDASSSIPAVATRSTRPSAAGVRSTRSAPRRRRSRSAARSRPRWGGCASRRRRGARAGLAPCPCTGPTSIPRPASPRNRTALALAALPPMSPMRCSSWCHATRVRGALPTDVGRGHGQGHRGHRDVPRRPTARAERGGWRPRPVRDRVDEFHRTNELRFRSWPRALLAATTHDTKRSADVRARIARSPRWPTAGSSRRLVASALCEYATTEGAPDADEQLFVLQTLVGAWPISRTRSTGTW